VLAMVTQVTDVMATWFDVSAAGMLR